MSLPVNVESLIGTRFGKLTIVRKADVNKFQKTTFYCKCDCGNYSNVTINSLKRENTLSCGCGRIGRITHGLKKHPLSAIWNGMKQRCNNVNSPNYKNYGARGIMVCDEWKYDLVTFYNWCISAGWRSGLEIDRIDNEGNYTPENCRIVTRSVNCNNTRRTIMLEYNGIKMALSDWAKHFNIKDSVLYDRVHTLKQPLERAFSNEANRTKPRKR